MKLGYLLASSSPSPPLVHLQGFHQRSDQAWNRGRMWRNMPQKQIKSPAHQSQYSKVLEYEEDKRKSPYTLPPLCILSQNRQLAVVGGGTEGGRGGHELVVLQWTALNFSKLKMTRKPFAKYKKKHEWEIWPIMGKSGGWRNKIFHVYTLTALRLLPPNK